MRIVREEPRRSEQPAAVADDVAGILEEVRAGGDRAVVRLTKRFDRADLSPGELRVEPAEVDAAPGVLEPAVLDGLRTAIANVRTVVEEIVTCTARLIANPVAHKLKAAEIDALVERIRS